MTTTDSTPATPRHDLRSEIKSALNRASAENASGTPDHVLADFLLACLDAFDAATRRRDGWWGHEPRIGGLIPAVSAPGPQPDPWVKDPTYCPADSCYADAGTDHTCPEPPF